jgi:hypothetical protein
MRRMGKVKLRVLLFVVLFITIGLKDSIGQDLLSSQLIDSKSENGIPYAYIKIIGKDLVVTSDEDGFFSLAYHQRDSIQISHVAYKTLNTSFEKIRDLKKIMMTELAIETNPIIISAKSAKSLVERAIDSSYKALYEPMYITCFRKDQLIYRDTLVTEAKAEIVYIYKDFGFVSFGGIYKGYLKNINVAREPQFQNVSIPSYHISAIFAPVNRYFLHTTPRYERQMYFSNQEANDSTIIIGMNPRHDFHPQKYILKYGRFIINKNTWKLQRIDTYVSPEMMKAWRSLPAKTEERKKYYHYYSVSYFFDWSGILSKILMTVHFSYKIDDPQKLWQNHSEIVYLPEKTKPEFSETNILKRDTLLIQMNSRYNPDFEKRFMDHIH